MIGRRAFLSSLIAGVVLASQRSWAQQGKVFQVGLLGSPTPHEVILMGAMRDLGYSEGTNLIVYRRFGTAADLPAMALELVRMKVDLILASASSGVRVAVNATREIPIVAVDLETDPVASGYVMSLARPGGNLTGFFLDLPEFSAKRLEVLKEALPSVSGVIVLWDPSLDRAPLSRMDAAARSLKLRLVFSEVRATADLDEAFQTARIRKAQAVMIMQSPKLDSYKDQILTLGARHRIPVIAVFSNFTAAGALLSYGPNVHDLVSRSATYVDRVLRGTKPADLPIQRPTKFDLVINLKTAKSLGVTIGQSMLLRADEIIQ